MFEQVVSSVILHMVQPSMFFVFASYAGLVSHLFHNPSLLFFLGVYEVVEASNRLWYFCTTALQVSCRCSYRYCCNKSSIYLRFLVLDTISRL